MSAILGHDIHGRPLKAGDEVMLVNTSDLFRHLEGATTCVVGKSPRNDYPIEIIPPTGFQDGFAPYTSSKYLRKLTGDHRSASESFTDLMHSLNNDTEAA